MCRVQAVLDVGEKWTDADDLRAQRECDEEEPGQYRGRAHSRILSAPEERRPRRRRQSTAKMADLQEFQMRPKAKNRWESQARVSARVSRPRVEPTGNAEPKRRPEG